MHLLVILGLVLNVAGSIIFIFDSNGLSGLLAKMVGHMAQGHGKFDGKSFSKKELDQLQKRILSSKRLNVIGYILFIVGFLPQLVALQIW